MSSSSISFDIKGIASLLEQHNFRVPEYQRSYKWERKHINELYTDIYNALDDKDTNEYFVGSIVVSAGKESRLEIVDGQQRIATISILIASIANYFDSIGESKSAVSLRSKYISEHSISDQDEVAKLLLSPQDNGFYHKKVVLRENPEPERDSHNRIAQALEEANEFISRLNISVTGRGKLVDLMDFLRFKVKVILVTVPDHANAFVIFETLNDRGLELAQTDLLKNYLFQNCTGDRLKEVQENWTKMVAIIEAAKSEELILKYVWHYWNSLHGLTREPQLYESIKKHVKNSRSAVELASGLLDNAERFVALLNPSHHLWSEYDPATKNHIEVLQELRLTQFRSLALSILRRFSKKEVEKAFKLILAISVRNLIYGQIGGGTLEKEFSRTAKAVSDGKIKNASDLRKELQSIKVHDIDFHRAFSEHKVSQAYLARYYLSALESYSNGEANPEGSLNRNTNVKNLEHILPKSIDNQTKAWPSFNFDQHKLFWNRLGNLTMLDSKMNTTLGNSTFLTKKEIYGESTFSLTSKLSEYKDWSPATIDQRQKEFADWAVKIWNVQFN